MNTANQNEYQGIDDLINQNLFDMMSEFVEIQTFRTGLLDETTVVANLEKIQQILLRDTEEFNKNQKMHRLESFDWKETITKTENGEEKKTTHWLFGLRLGAGKHKITVCSHLDTVPPGSIDDWDDDPFRLLKKMRSYPDGPEQEFYVGRGSIDDKGPAIVAFNVLKAVAKRYDGSPKLDNITVELLFDTSEETEMSMPHYLNNNPDDRPDFGLIYDGVWTVRAEKGIERPFFSITGNSEVTEGAWIDQMLTPLGPSNQIPGSATVTIKSTSPDQLQEIADNVKQWYEEYAFDDETYRRADMTSHLDGIKNELKIETKVKGAQHGSAPNENREIGANPLVSLANFLGGLVDNGILVSNETGVMCQFISWAWGTTVYGEHHSQLLEKNDDVFKKGNGTTYAVTRFHTKPKSVQLELDVRYAIGHHSTTWDGKTEGMLEGISKFPEVFNELTEEFNKMAAHQVMITTKTAVAPDIRLTEGDTFRKIANAFEKVMNVATPALAIGGGTDAKGDNNLMAGGALFINRLGPPINFHGFNEGVPVGDLKNGARIIYRLFVDEIETSS